MSAHEYADSGAYLLDIGLDALDKAASLPQEDRVGLFIETATRLEEDGYSTRDVMQSINQGAQQRREIGRL